MASTPEEQFKDLLLRSTTMEYRQSLRIVVLLLSIGIPLLALFVFVQSTALLLIGTLFVLCAVLFYRYSVNKRLHGGRYWYEWIRNNRFGIIWVKPETDFSTVLLANKMFQGVTVTLYTEDDYFQVILRTFDDLEGLIHGIVRYAPTAHVGSSYTVLRYFEQDSKTFRDKLKAENAFLSILDNPGLKRQQ